MADFGFSDGTEGDHFVAVKITTTPGTGGGTLTLSNGQTVKSGPVHFDQPARRRSAL